MPPLREELQLHAGPRSRDGSPTWTLEDPARARFFRIGWSEVEMLARWDLGDPEAIVAAVNRETPLDIEVEDIEEFAKFLAASNLLQVRGADGNERLKRQADATKMGWAKWLLKNYLFVRIPLVRPEKFLNAAMPFVAPLYSGWFFALTLMAAVTGLFLVARQWDTFIHTFLHFFSLEGMALMGIALLGSKVLHELGHAFTAKRFGCRVPTMGVAFLVMWPVLYTDTSGAWTVPDRRKRLAIGAAGMGAELALAAYATLLWSFLPDGPVRSAVFLLATSTWILTLVVNLNPCMRFDGYFLMADLLDIANLQDRSFRLARWWMREKLFALGEAKPETFEPKMERTLILYAFATWIYRFFLFLGIAILVYHVFFKVLGIFLMIVELAWFIGRPIWNELQEWWKRREAYQLNLNTGITLTVLVTALVLVVFPWRGTIHAPALLRAEDQGQLYAPGDSRLSEVLISPGQSVTEGEVLFRFTSPDLEHRLTQAARRIDTLRWQATFHALDGELSANRQIVWQELETALAERTALERERARLTITAPFAGTVAEKAWPLIPGEWMPEGEWLGTVVSPGTALIEAYVPEADLGRLVDGADARFYPEEPSRPVVPLRLVEIAKTATRRLTATPELASLHGGGVAAIPDRDGTPVPERAVYRILLQPAAGLAAPDLALRGTVRLEGERQSLLVTAWRGIVSVLVRESGF